MDAFPRLRDVPAGYWPVVVVDDVKGSAGYHLDRNGQPYALVEYSDNWSLTASHEAIEMVVDPWGKRIAPGARPSAVRGRSSSSWRPAIPVRPRSSPRRSTACSSRTSSPRASTSRARRRARATFTGARPPAPPDPARRLHVLARHAVQPLWQQLWLGAGKRYRDLGEGDFSRQGSLRGLVDARTDHPDLDHGLAQTDATLVDARIGWRGATASAEAPRQPMRLEEEIERPLS